MGTVDSMHQVSPPYPPPNHLRPPPIISPRTTHTPLLPPPPMSLMGAQANVFWKEAFSPLPKYCHFVSATSRRCLQSADRMYLSQIVSIDDKSPWCGAWENDVSALFFGSRRSAPFPNTVTLCVQHANTVCN